MSETDAFLAAVLPRQAEAGKAIHNGEPELWAQMWSHEIELLAAGASGDLAYTVAYENTTASVDGRPAAPYRLRVTYVYRRENGDWHIVHRHGDTVPEAQ